MRIDPHVHCRDGRQSYKETIAHVFRLCDQNGVDMIFDMPNTDPPLLRAADVEKRLRLVPESGQRRYRVFLGVTTDAAQLREAVDLTRECKQVVGLKMYAGQSEGALAVCAESDQRKVYKTLAGLDYRGVLALHCEKENMCRKEFDPQKPFSHCASRPPAAELRAIQDQLNFARAAGFRGHLHVCHVSTAESVALIRSARADLHISCGVTPHHLLWSNTQMINKEGLLYKVNPPLRELSDCIALRYALKEGNIDWIESDHAPHPISEKLYPPYASGYPALCLYGELVANILPLWGFDETLINRITCDNIKHVFFERKLDDHS